MINGKGTILIVFAWAVEVVGVVAGFVTAVVTTYPDGKLPTSLWSWLMVLPMGMIAVVELGRIPLTSVLFQRHQAMQAIAFVRPAKLATERDDAAGGDIAQFYRHATAHLAIKVKIRIGQRWLA